MPPLPDVRRVPRQKWTREIKRKLKPQELGATASDVGVTRKIEKNLHNKCEATGPRSQPTRMRRRIVEVQIGHGSESIGKHHLFYQTREDKDDSTLNHNRRRAGANTGICEINCQPTNDRACNQMRKKRNEQRVVNEISLRLHFSPVDVERIGKTGERVEADANGQDNLQHDG